MHERFTIGQKRLITALISLAGIIGPPPSETAFASGSFIPTIPEIAKDLNTSGTVINYTVGAYVFTLALGNLFWGPYAEFCDWVSYTSLFLSPVLAVGAATISDIYVLEERGTAMGIFFGAILMGPPLAPLFGGVVATYFSWRATQLFIFLLGFIAFISVVKFLPETSHPGSRGIDGYSAVEELKGFLIIDRKQWVWLNPFKPLGLARNPAILFVAVSASLALTTFYGRYIIINPLSFCLTYSRFQVLSIPLAFILGPKYGITTPAQIGACFLPSGIGSMLGATISGRLADRAIIKGRIKRQGKWIPEDRLRACLPGALLLLPASLIGYALTTIHVPGRLGLCLTLVFLFLNGLGVDMVLSPAATYFVDVLRTQSAEIMAVYSAFRSAFCAIVSAGVLPAVNMYGVVYTNTLAAGIAWIGFLHGHELREWLDIGFTCITHSEVP
ncbi:hypothetical protein Clacol_005968 [Clathrus columnatus]|uniref:Major facilitator superfamily (MFS) profile domain-containing protein n=1 Tax=Clathrus columnatus TaxID=1419009 RepID=A0AAV5ABL0_9AGAM|nr:hypothetical protein Clacol_005968 [Clathrus columnatus]